MFYVKNSGADPGGGSSGSFENFIKREKTSHVLARECNAF